MPRRKKDNSEIVKEEKDNINKEMTLKINKKEIYWIVGVMIGLIAVLLISSYLFKESNNFSYQTLKFTKSLYGQIPIYVYTYYFKDNSYLPPKEYKYNLILRVDPRENKVPVNGEIKFIEGAKNVFISFKGIDKCKDASRDVATLSSFLTVNLFNVTAGLNDKEEAKKDNLTHITCENRPYNSVLVLQTGNETKIEKTADNCYVISVAKCELMEAVEKFEIQSIVDSKKRQTNR